MHDARPKTNTRPRKTCYLFHIPTRTIKILGGGWREVKGSEDNKRIATWENQYKGRRAEIGGYQTQVFNRICSDSYPLKILDLKAILVFTLSTLLMKVTMHYISGV